MYGRKKLRLVVYVAFKKIEGRFAAIRVAFIIVRCGYILGVAICNDLAVVAGTSFKNSALYACACSH